MRSVLAAISVIASVALAGPGQAQTFAERFDDAQAQIQQKAWPAALRLLLELEEVAASDAECESLAAKLHEVGNALADASAFAAALRAEEVALALRRHIHGEADHALVAACLNHVAFYLQSLGRFSEALAQFEAELAMWKRMHGDLDLAQVARGSNNVAFCLQALGRADEALSMHEAALAMRRRLHGDVDHPDVATCLNNLASCLQLLGRVGEALPNFEAALAMRRRVHGGVDHPSIIASLNNVASCLHLLGRDGDALPLYEAALAMSRRLYGEADHPLVATALNSLAHCLQSLGRAGDALPLFEAALAMRRRVHGEAPHPDVATSLNNVAFAQQSLGHAREALPLYEESLAMRRRVYGQAPHPDVAASLHNIADCLRSLGRAGEGLPLCEEALAIGLRLSGGADRPAVAMARSCLAGCLCALGRYGEALPHYEAALSAWQRIHRNRDHPDLVSGLNGVAFCLQAIGRAGEALPLYETALAMRRRIHGDADHPGVALSLNNAAGCLMALGSDDEALRRFAAALAMHERIYGNRDHPDTARSHNNVALGLQALGRVDEALPHYETALAMHERLYGDIDHPLLAKSLNNVAYCLQALGRPGEALPACARAAAIVERLRDDTRTSAELRQSSFDDMKRGGVFERLQALAVQVGKSTDALLAAERSRSRDLLDRIEQQRFDADLEAERRARQRGDEATAVRVRAVRAEIQAAHTEGDRILRELTRLVDRGLADVESRSRHEDLLAQSKVLGNRARQLHDERARLLGDLLPVGRVRTPAEIQSTLRTGEILLEFTVTEGVGLLHVLTRSAEVETFALPAAFATVGRELDSLLQRRSRAGLAPARGRDPEGGPAVHGDESAPRALFAALIPAALWPRLQASRRVFVAAHRSLHRLPFELLVTGVQDGVAVYWIDTGPPICYVPSGSLLHWLRRRAADVDNDAMSLDLLAVGDPSPLDAAFEVPEHGVFVVAVDADGGGARAGIRPGDVITAYDGQPLADDKDLDGLRRQTESALEEGKRDEPIALGLWRRGQSLELRVEHGPLGIQVGVGTARTAAVASRRGTGAKSTPDGRGPHRTGWLPPLAGAREEAVAIERVFARHDKRTAKLLGADATEPAVFDLAARAKFVHFACHGIAEEYAGQSLSMLVLSPPMHVLPADDGFLTLGDLLDGFRGRLSSCRLVVLSACRTNVGSTLRDDAPQALPIGFLFAGVPAVISSLWAVDDASTRELMTDMYARLLAGEKDKLAAFVAAKKALRQKFPDPFHWAPFQYIGSPD